MIFEYKSYYPYRNSQDRNRYDLTRYDISVEGDCIVVNDTRMRCKEDSAYTYKLLHSSIKAFDGAKGLMNFMVRTQRYAECDVLKICEHVIRYGNKGGNSSSHH